MYICYSIDTNGGIALQYSNSSECRLMQEFRAEVSSHKTISVDTALEEYSAEDAYRDLGMCSGQEKLATVLCSNQNNRSDSFGVRPPL